MNMKLNSKITALLSVLAVASLLNAAPKIESENWIWSDTPAQSFNADWTIPADNVGAGKGWEPEGYPVGNGRIGAMILGNAARERIALNEISLWTGGENAGGNCSGYGYGPTAGRNAFGSYQPFGDLLIESPGLDAPKDFVRALSLAEGIAYTSFKQNGVEYTREVFASTPQNVIAVVYRASKKGKINVNIALSPNHTAKLSAHGNTITMAGTLANDMEFAANLTVIADGGSVSASGGSTEIPVSYVDKGDNLRASFDTAKLPKISVKNADSLVILVAMNTDYLMSERKNWKGADPVKTTAGTIAAAQKVSAEMLRKKHVAAHGKLFNRCKIDLGTTDKKTAALPTAQRIKNYPKTKNDPDLEENLFQFGRYLLMSSSKNSLPANLQGLWNHKVHAPWASDYHNNINIQEAYWPAEVTNLSECHKPLLNYITETAAASRVMTKKEFGENHRGWTTRISQNPWGWGGWTMWNVPINAWYALHMWEHYQFTHDKKFLKEQAYPMMKEACHFWEDHLKELGKDGKGFYSADAKTDIEQLKGMPAGTLVAPKGWSHEWGPVEDGVAHDQQLVRDLFRNTIAAAKVLGVDAAWTKKLQDKLERVAPDKISPNGYLQEWLIDRPNMVSGHRHTSHLFAVFPGSEISVSQTPDLAEAAKQSLELRGTTGDSRRSWSWPWRTALWARFKEGDKAHQMIEGLFEFNTLPNMLTTHPPFQMDGNFSYPAGVAEMLLQSHAGQIELLPAPCKAWPAGKVRGMKARGNITVSFDWKNGRVTKYSLYSPTPQKVKLVINGREKEVTTKPFPSAKKKAATTKTTTKAKKATATKSAQKKKQK